MSHLEGLFLVLPLLGALIGYTTKSLAIQMLFRPAEFVGIGPVGWQGVIQRRSAKFALGIADTLAGTGVDAKELFAGIDLEPLIEALSSAIADSDPTLLEEVLKQTAPETWEELGSPERNDLISSLRNDAPALIESLIEAVRPTLEETLDLRGLVVEMLSGENADRLARLARRVCARELRFLVWYGAVLGFFIGLIEVGVYVAVGQWWLLPIIGMIDGLVNNWLALRMIFRPLERTRYLGLFPYQGMFPARQAEIAHDYAEMVAGEVLTLGNLMGRVMEPARLHQIVAAAAERIAAYSEASVGTFVASGVRPSSRLSPGLDIDAVAPAVFLALAPVMPSITAQIESQLKLDVLIEDRLAGLPKLEFERLLRGIFEEDESIVVALGGFIGAAIGSLQASIVLLAGFGH